MSETKLEAYFFTAIFLVALVVVGIVFYPFIGSLALAVVLASLVAPLSVYVQKKIKNRSLASLLVTLIVTIAIIAPAVGLSFLLVSEITNITDRISSYDFSHIPSTFTIYHVKLIELFPFLSSFNFVDIFQDSFRSLGSHFAGALTNTAGIILKFFVALIALYYFIKDGKHFLEEIIELSPLEDSEDVAIVKRLDRVTHSLIRGTLVIAALQGIFVGLGFVLFGVPGPVLWGSIAAISALIPTLGTGIVTAPAIIYLLVTGHIAAGIGLFAWAMLIVGLVDNIIGPKLIGSGARIHPLLVLLSVLGGLGLFGISGFLLGPLFLGLLMALSEIYKVKIKELHKQSK